jgi:plasmid stability protein
MELIFVFKTEEAVELLGHSDTAETRALLSQAGIQVADTVPSSHQIASSGTPALQVSKEDNPNIYRN